MPQSHPQPLLVVAGIIIKDGKILIAQRLHSCRHEPDKWEFPGGKVELFEHPEDALVREIKEELGIRIAIRSFFGTVSHITKSARKKDHVLLLVYVAECRSGKLKHHDVQDSRWVAAGELSSFDFAKADIPIVDELKRCCTCCCCQ